MSIPTRIEIPNAIVHKHMLLGGRPTAGQLEDASKHGFKLIIDLRMPGEPGVADEIEQAKRLGIRYEAIAMPGAAGLTEENARALDDLISQTDGPILLHCASGNRVGALLALRAHTCHGLSPAESMALGLQTGMTSLQGALREKIGI